MDDLRRSSTWEKENKNVDSELLGIIVHMAISLENNRSQTINMGKTPRAITSIVPVHTPARVPGIGTGILATATTTWAEIEPEKH